MQARRLSPRSPVLWACWLSAVCLGVAALAWPAAAQDPKKQEQKREAPLSRTEQRARALLRLDAAARKAFNEEHPGVLPELNLRLPKATAVAFNWLDYNGVSGAHEQKALDCWANAITEAVECSWLIRNGVRIYLSPQPLLDRTQNVDRRGFSIGNNVQHAADLLLKHGTAGFGRYPYTGKPDHYRSDVKMPYRIVAWGEVAPDHNRPTVEQLKQTLRGRGPLAVGVYSNKAFKQFRGNGVFGSNVKLDKPQINHFVLLVGWNDRKGKHGAWRIRNSWSPSWGDDGYAWIEYDCNCICLEAIWVKAQSIYYRLPEAEFLKLVPDGESLPRWNSPLNVARNGQKAK
jgi:C1A family cysteine protease